MKKQFNQLLGILSLVGLLAGCEQKHDYQYLLQHPLVTKEEATKCLDVKYQQQESTNQCKLVMLAASKLMVVISEQQEDPERFGQKILDLEEKYAQTKAVMFQAQLQVKQAASESEAQMTLGQAEKAYNEIYSELKMLLAVAGLNSPE